MEEKKRDWKKYYNPAVQNKATAKYQKENMKRYAVSFHLKSDADIIARLDGMENKTGYLRQLIRDDIARG